LALAPSESVNVATSAVTDVPNGTVMAIEFPVMTPVAAGLVNEKAVIAFGLMLGATVTVTV